MSTNQVSLRSFNPTGASVTLPMRISGSNHPTTTSDDDSTLRIYAKLERRRKRSKETTLFLRSVAPASRSEPSLSHRVIPFSPGANASRLRASSREMSEVAKMALGKSRKHLTHRGSDILPDIKRG